MRARRPLNLRCFPPPGLASSRLKDHPSFARRRSAKAGTRPGGLGCSDLHSEGLPRIPGGGALDASVPFSHDKADEGGARDAMTTGSAEDNRPVNAGTRRDVTPPYASLVDTRMRERDWQFVAAQRSKGRSAAGSNPGARVARTRPSARKGPERRMRPRAQRKGRSQEQSSNGQVMDK